MAYQDLYRLSAHAIIINSENKILMLKATYNGNGWHFPGWSFDAGETVHQCILRECQEELGCQVKVKYLSGIYYHKNHNSHTFIFRCELEEAAKINLSSEHSDYGYLSLKELTPAQFHRVMDCLNFTGEIKSHSFD